jgi:hypothetical protein
MVTAMNKGDHHVCQNYGGQGQGIEELIAMELGVVTLG